MLSAFSRQASAKRNNRNPWSTIEFAEKIIPTAGFIKPNSNQPVSPVLRLLAES
jgi:hypothetical protein